MLKIDIKRTSFERVEVQMKLDNAIQSFRTFKEKCSDASPFYEYLTSEILKDEDILELSVNVKEDQPIADTFLGAVHYILIRGVDHSLALYYPSISDRPKPVEEMYPHFVDFCTIYRGELVSLMKRKHIQTNEVRRSAYLYPVFSSIYADEKSPLALVEIGTGSGLQLFLDAYSYTYGDGRVQGNRHANVHISSKLVGEPEDELSFLIPKINSRIGIDLHSIDVTKEEDRMWLEALIWPEDEERRNMFDEAIENIHSDQVEWIEGDGIALLENVVKDIPKEEVLVVFHTHVAHQFSEEQKDKLLKKIEAIGKERPIYHIYNNIWDRKLHLDYVSPESKSSFLVGTTERHGRWFTWEMEKVESPYLKK